MEKVKEYNIISGDYDFVIKSVNENISQGWHPLGGISSTKGKRTDPKAKVSVEITIYSQAMVR